MNWKLSNTQRHDGLIKIQKIMLLFTILFLPITNMPRAMMISAIGEKLSYYPILIGLLVWFLEIYQTKKFNIDKKYLRYVSIFIIWQLLCTVIGVLTYEYYNLLDLSQADKLKYILAFGQKYGLNIEVSDAFKLWLPIRFVKDTVKYDFFIFGCTLWIYHLYKDDWHKGFLEIRQDVLILTLVMGTYSLVEMAYLKGFSGATKILSTINPLFYDVQSAHGWWPPLLWQGQLRSVFPEPSYFSITAVMVVPFLFSYIFNKIKLSYVVIYIFYILMLFLTKARTATVLYIGEMVLLVMATAKFLRFYWKRTCCIILCGLIAFIVTITCFNVKQDFGQSYSVSKEASTYINKNVTSVVGNKRSNSARMANFIATLQVGLQHPAFGVGYQLRNAYINDNLPEWSYDNFEVRDWSRYMYIKGVLNSNFPPLNEFVTMFASYGFIGLLIYVLPILYVLSRLLKNKGLRLNNNIETVSMVIAFLGSVVAMLSNAEFFTYYILLGLLLCVINGDRIEQ